MAEPFDDEAEFWREDADRINAMSTKARALGIVVAVLPPERPAPPPLEADGALTSNAEDTTNNCGGPGSGRPGPCPGSSGGGSLGERLSEAVTRASREDLSDAEVGAFLLEVRALKPKEVVALAERLTGLRNKSRADAVLDIMAKLTETAEIRRSQVV